jgi:hypothetical protein
MSDKAYRLETIDDAKQYVAINSKNNKGVTCPCCQGFVKVYKRRITKNAVRALGIILKAAHMEFEVTPYIRFKYIHIQEVFSKLGLRATAMDYIQLERFGLIEKQIDERTKQEKADKKDIGMWKPTELGYDFFCNRATIPKYIMVLNNEEVGRSIINISVTQCIKDRHIYEEIMKTYGL